MKHISNLIDLEEVKKDKVQSEKTSKGSAEVINWLFKMLRSNFTAFRQAWPDDEAQRSAKKTWLKAFMLAKINRIEQIEHGLNKCYLMDKPFVPSPGEFISWCKPSPQDLGFPTTEEAFLLSIQVNRQFSEYQHHDERIDTVIRHAIRQIGSSSYREMNTDNARKTFKSYYETALNQFINGEINVIPKLLPEKPEPHPADRPRTDEARKKAMDAIRGLGINVKRIDD